MSKCVILREDEPDLADLVRELLGDAGYSVVVVQEVEELLVEATRRSPCVALIDSTSPTSFDLWWLGPKLVALGIPPVAFTAHVSARRDFEADNHQFAGIISKPFDADEFVDLVNSICWDEYHAAAS
jgi:DNA-binding NtrC family response regulator